MIHATPSCRDEAQLGWFHLRAVIVSGVGCVHNVDAYDIFVISQGLPMIYQLDFNGNYPNGVHVDAWMKASTNWGNFVGQIGFGILGDQLGRKKMYGVELIIMIVCTLGSALASSLAYGWNILVILSVWRFFLGIGIGGDYPMSAVITSEFANVKYRGMMLAAVFAMQGIGILVGGLVYVITLAAMKNQIQQDYLALDTVWRLAVGFGIIPALGAVYFRLTIPESPRFTMIVEGEFEKGRLDMIHVTNMNSVANLTSNWDNPQPTGGQMTRPPTPSLSARANTFQDFVDYFGQWKNAKVLLGASYCWFALDVGWYGISLNQSVLLGLINFNGPSKVAVNMTMGDGSVVTNHVMPPVDIWDVFHQIAVGNIIIAFAGTVPGYWVAVALIERMGRKPIQILGFAVITICLIILAADWSNISKQQGPFLFVFTVAQFFFQFGPNTTTFVVPGEVFPTRFRSTGHGISAASGKIGAILGIQAVGPYFSANAQLVLAVFAIILFTGGLATFLLPETKGKTLEELSEN
ncbi:major facilitator superfamily domain-containing protein [Chytriomyces sp. MP71]|nr:major facilitator superfamily domain-containing protein [Chytriomyces sp. MP71]